MKTTRKSVSKKQILSLAKKDGIIHIEKSNTALPIKTKNGIQMLPAVICRYTIYDQAEKILNEYIFEETIKSTATGKLDMKDSLHKELEKNKIVIMNK